MQLKRCTTYGKHHGYRQDGHLDLPHRAGAQGASLPTAAEREHRSVANMVEVLVLDWCGRTGIAIPEQAELFPPAATRDGRNPTRSK